MNYFWWKCSRNSHSDCSIVFYLLPPFFFNITMKCEKSINRNSRLHDITRLSCSVSYRSIYSLHMFISRVNLPHSLEWIDRGFADFRSSIKKSLSPWTSARGKESVNVNSDYNISLEITTRFFFDSVSSRILLFFVASIFDVRSSSVISR